MSLFVGWPSLSYNDLMQFMNCLLPLIYLKNLFIVPHSSGQLHLHLSFGSMNFSLQWTAEALYSCHISWPYFHWGYRLIFCLTAKKDSWSAKLDFCLICATSNILELPAPVPLGGGAWEVTSTDGPQHLQTHFPSGPYSLVSWAAWNLPSSGPGLESSWHFFSCQQRF